MVSLGRRSEGRTASDPEKRSPFRAFSLRNVRKRMQKGLRRSRCAMSTHSSAALRSHPHGLSRSLIRPFFINKMIHKRTISRIPHKINRKSHFFPSFQRKNGKNRRLRGFAPDSTAAAEHFRATSGPVFTESVQMLFRRGIWRSRHCGIFGNVVTFFHNSYRDRLTSPEKHGIVGHIPDYEKENVVTSGRMRNHKP